ncbi:acyl-thioesterase [Coniochaeta sp. 2T2.1]|nr:acyl-thioesterase [Coniochaeta sp. 2T2.1]
MASRDGDGDARQTFQEAMEMLELPPTSGRSTSTGSVRRFMATRAAWLPGVDLGDVNVPSIREGKKRPGYNSAYGGHVYAQGALAMCRVQADAEKKKGTKPLGLHTIHGYFTFPGYLDRPFVYTVTPLTSGRSFSTSSVTAHQPLTPSNNPARDHFPLSDASLPLGPPAFTAMASFKSSALHTGGGTVSSSEPSVQSRFAAILSSRPADAWPPSPPVDIDLLTAVVGKDLVGTFPAVEMRKVDMTAFNAGLPLHEQRELILYRLLAPLPAGGDWDDPNAHVCVHAFTVDRNGLLMIGNSLGIGRNPGRSASLSYSFVVHTNAEEAVMNEEEWWVQECIFPRTGHGRGMIVCKVWSPRGVHVATEFQDGLCEAHEERGERGGAKL